MATMYSGATPVSLCALLEARAMFEHELRAFGDALLGEKALAVLPPRRHLLGRLADGLDDLRLRLGLGEQAVHVERLHFLRGRGGFDEFADLGAIEIETGATGRTSLPRERNP